MKLSKHFYKAARKLGKVGSIFNDIETLMTGDPKKIAKRAVRKHSWKASNKATRKFTDRFK
jgi:hypothetical protein